MIDAGRFRVCACRYKALPLAEGSKDEDLVSIRSEFFENAHLLQHWVVHGHTPIETPRQEGRRFNLDTGAFSTGKLSALRLWQKKGRVFTT